MKKFLSLVLALVMTMSLVTISAGATDFTDDSKIQYEAAVKVMDMLNVVGGYSDSTFRPANNLTRGAAAKIITNLKLTPAVADALKGSETPFKDVPATNVFSGAIAYCASEGIITGYADGTFRPAGTLTGNAFMKMLIGVLGYDTADYTGKNFATKVALKVKKLGLADGTTFVGAKAATREEACLYAFNALFLNTAYYTGGSKVTINGAEIVVGATENTDGDPLAKAFGLTKNENAKDAFGRPATKYTAGKKNVTIADTPVLTMKGAVTVKGAAVALGLGKNETAVLQRPDRAAVTVSITGDNTTAEFGSSYNSVTYFYANTDKNSKTDYDLYTVEYHYGVVDKVNAANAKKEIARSIVIKDETGSVVTNKYETELFAAKDIVLWTKAAGSTVVDVVLADTIKGTVTGKRGTTVTVGGKTYANEASVNVKDDGIFTLSYDGTTIIAKDATGGVSSDLYAYVYYVLTKTSEGGYDENGVWTEGGKKTYTAYFVKADGTKGSAPVASNIDTGVWNYSITDKGVFNNIQKVNAETVKLDGKLNAYGSIYPTASTQYVFVKTEGTNQVTKLTVNTATGYKNAKVAAGDNNAYAATAYVVAANGADTAVTVFVTADPDTVKVEGLRAVVTDKVISENLNAEGKTIYTFKAFNGADVDLEVAEGFTMPANVANGSVISYKLVDGKATDVALVDVTKAGEVYKTIEDSLIVAQTNGTKDIYTLNASTVVYVIDAEGNYKVGALTDIVNDMDVTVYATDKGVATLVIVK